jgi:glycosyltransferase involved in cell wall biosynthesis
MKIGLVTACYKPVINGVTHMVSLMKDYLEEAGHEVTVFTLGEPDPAGEEPGVVRSPGIPVGDTGYYFGFRYSSHAQELLREMDIIHCHHLFMSVEMAHRYGRCPIVYTNHTRYDLYTGAYTALPQPAADAVMRQVWPDFTDYCDVVVTPSDSVRQVMLDFGVRRPIRVIENGIELDRFHRTEQAAARRQLQIAGEKTRLIYVGRLSSEKNLEMLLAQFAIVQNIVPEIELILVGKGPAEKHLQKQARELDIADCVRFAGVVPYAEVPQWLAAADMFVTASLSEVHPLTVIEAMAAGLPIVAPASPGITDTVKSGEMGLLSDYPDGGLAAGMAALILNPELRRQMGCAARDGSRLYDIRRTIEKTMTLYERLRQERPDLTREKPHGGWRNYVERVQPLVEQLAGLLRPPDGRRHG